MKKRLSVLLAILLLIPFGASAEKQYYQIQELHDQPIKRWTKTYEVMGRTVNVDVMPTVPDVDAMPVLVVAAKAWFPETKENVEWTGKTQADYEKDLSAPGNFSLKYDDGTGPNGDALSKKYDIDTVDFYAPFDPDYPYMETKDLTLRQVFDKLRQVMGEISNAGFGVDTEHLHFFCGNWFYEKGTKKHVESGGQWMQLYTTLRGIPLWGHAVDSIREHKDQEFSYDPHFTWSISSLGQYSMFGKVVTETGMLAPDVPLCGMEIVIEALEEEIQAGRLRTVYGLDLGFVLVNEPGLQYKTYQQLGSNKEKWRRQYEEMRMYAIPAWRCLCLYTEQTRRNIDGDMVNPMASMFYQQIYVNAQTGKLIDPTDTKIDSSAFQGFLSWEETGK